MQITMKKSISNMFLFRTILSHHSLMGGQFYRLLWLMIFISFLEMWFPYISKYLYQHIENKDSRDQIVQTFLLWAGYITLTIWLSFFKSTWKSVMNTQYENKLMMKYRDDLRHHSYQSMIDHSSWTLLSKFEQGVNGEIQIFETTLNIIVSSLIRGWSIIIIYLWTDYRLILILIPFILIYAYIERKVGKPLEDIGEKVRVINEEKTDKLSSFFSSFFTIKLWNQFDHEQKGFGKTLDQLPALTKKETWLSSLKYDSLWYLFNILDIGLIAVLGYQVIIWSDYRISDIIFLTTYIRWFWSPLSHLVNSFSTFQKHISKYQWLYEFLYKSDQLVNGSLSYKYHNGTIECKGVTFGYHGKKTLFDSFDLTIPWGKTIAFVGHSWSGKTTLIKLLLRFFDPQSWSLLIDGQELKNLDLSSYYNHIWYLTQDPAIFDGTIEDNLMYGYTWSKDEDSIEVREQEMQKALSLAKCDFVEHLPEWIHTKVGDRGVKLSGWEKQRLAIARIFLKNPPILIFDEPTSALDSMSERAITQSMSTLFANRTVVIIAHRLQTVINADHIILLDHGRIVQQGKHKELITQDWPYKEMVDLQSGAMLNDEEDETDEESEKI